MITLIAWLSMLAVGTLVLTAFLRDVELSRGWEEEDD